MNALHWKYLGEGGMHVLFVYDPPRSTIFRTDVVKEWEGKVIRLRKCDLMGSIYPQPTNYSPEYVNRGWHQNEGRAHIISNENWYYERIVGPRLTPYIDVPEKINVETSFVSNLYQYVIQNDCIPSSRRKDWYNIQYNERILMASTQMMISAVLIDDYRQINSSSPSISIEIKPKAGYLTTSPLVNPLNRAKYNLTRFEILQSLQYQGFVNKGWNHKLKLETKSQYNPIDLFSDDRERIKRALMELFSCPQNNLKVTYRNDDDKVSSILYGHNTIKSSKDMYHHEALGNLFHIDVGDSNDDIHAILSYYLQNITAFILEKEDFLSKLKDLQKLDWIDEDGAILIYHHLVNLCNGSHEDAEKVLDSQTSIKQSKGISNNYREFSISPFCAEKVSDRVYKLVELNSVIRCFIQKDSHLDNHTNILNGYYERAKCLIHDLTILDCQFILQNWLLSLSMCDVSFFVTISPSTNSISSSDIIDNIYHMVNDFSQQDFLVKQQDLSSPGAMIYCGREILYRVKVIDYDKKPASKLRKRYLKEYDT